MERGKFNIYDYFQWLGLIIQVGAKKRRFPEKKRDLVAQAPRELVVLTHLTAKPDNDYTGWANEVKKHFSGQVPIAKDLMEF